MPKSAISKIGASSSLLTATIVLRRLHAGAVLDRPGDAQRDVQLRRHGLAGLADLELARVVAGVHRGTRGADGRAQRVGQFLDHAEVLGAADTAATGDDDRGLGELRAVAGHRRLACGDLGRVLGGRGHLDVDAARPRRPPAAASIAPGRTVITGVSPLDLASTV